MISLPDFKEKQILFIKADWGERASIRFLNDNIVFTKGGQTVNRASCHKVFAVFILGDIAVTTGLLKKGLQYGVSFFFLKNNFELYAPFLASAEGNYLLRMKQYSLPSKEEFSMAQKLVKNKIINQLSLLEDVGKLKDAKEFERNILNQIESAVDDQQLLGLEGNVSKQFFSMYFKDINWRRRSPRTKQDIPNFLMDVGYTFLFNFVEALLKLHGFDSYKGFYHKLFFQRKSLACDIMEPMRCLMDKQILKSYNLKQIKENDFKIEGGKYILPFENSAKYASLFMQALMDRKEDIFSFVHDFYRFMMCPEKNKFPEFKLIKI